MTFGGLRGGYLCVPQAKGKRKRNRNPTENETRNHCLCRRRPGNSVSTPFFQSRCPFSTPAEPQKPESFVSNHTHISHPFFQARHTHSHRVKVLRTHTLWHFAARTMHSEKNQCATAVMCLGIPELPRTKISKNSTFLGKYIVFCGNRSCSLSLFLAKQLTAMKSLIERVTIRSAGKSPQWFGIRRQDTFSKGEWFHCCHLVQNSCWQSAARWLSKQCNKLELARRYFDPFCCANLWLKCRSFKGISLNGKYFISN